MGTSEVWPGGVTARAIESADAEAWAELLATVDLYEKLGFQTKHQQIRHRLPIG